MYSWLRPLLFLLPAEKAHSLALSLLRPLHRSRFLRARIRSWVGPMYYPRLTCPIFRAVLPSPVGLAAGFDKDGEVFEAFGALGFGFVEVGTLTPKPQPGNPLPRLFRLPQDRALVNRLGFNGKGVDSALARLQGPSRTMFGINIGKNKDTPNERAMEDYVACARAVGGCPALYVAVNVSSPNTPGLRALQNICALRSILVSVRQTLNQFPHPLPLVVKVSPDLSLDEIDGVGELVLELGLDGVIATNTTLSRRRESERLCTTPAKLVAIGEGGLSGEPLKVRARAVVARLYRKLRGRVPVIGVGGISSGDDALAMVRAGAALVQLYTGLIYQGPGIARTISREMDAYLEREGLDNVCALVGKDCDRYL